MTLPVPKYTKENVLFLKGLIEAGEYRAVIDRRYPLEHVVEATKYVETEQKTGNVVLTVDGEGLTHEGSRPRPVRPAGSAAHRGRPGAGAR